MKDRAVKWLLDRMLENSTWRGIILLLTSLGVVIKPATADKIIAGGLAAAALLNIARREPAKRGPRFYRCKRCRKWIKA
jgi:hypothetical protein